MTAPCFGFGGMMSHKYIFTNKIYSVKGIMSTILGVMDLISLFLVVYLSYQNKGVALPRFGATGVLITLFSFVGLILAILSKYEPDRFYLFSYLGMGLNIVSLLAVSFILYAGAYGL